jgi:hypothetical protein
LRPLWRRIFQILSAIRRYGGDKVAVASFSRGAILASGPQASWQQHPDKTFAGRISRSYDFLG